MSKLEQSHQKALNEEEMKQKRAELKAKEAASEVDDAKKEEELLKNLQNL
jgi:hypothetical protein